MEKTSKVGKFLGRVLLLALGMCFIASCKPSPEKVAERTELLFKAIDSNDVEMAKQCIKKGANVNFERECGPNSKLYTPLIYAIQKENEEIIDVLIKSKADVNHKDPSSKFSPLVWALRSGNESKRHSMIKKLAAVNADLSAGLFYAGKFPVSLNDMKFLIELGADINAQDEDGWTPVMVAASTGYDMKVLPFIQVGADLNIKSNDGDTALSLAKESHAWNKDSLISLLKSCGAKE